MAEKNHRMCVSCRQTAHRDQLWRVVRTYPYRKMQLDYGIGRSAYLCPTASCLSAAKKKNRLAKALRTSVPAEIYQCLENRLLQDGFQEIEALGRNRSDQAISKEV